MARRKKEPRSVHREAIASAASELFEKKGIDATSMDDIAKAAGYSKATLYVYFENKEEIIAVLVMESMKKLYTYITDAVEQCETSKERYRHICQGLVRYQAEFPLYFGMVLDNIRIPGNINDCMPEETQTWQVGEQINEELAVFLQDGIDKGELRPDIPIIETILAFWGMISGLLQIAVKKEIYINDATGLQQEQFMEYGFEMLYRSIEQNK